MLLQRNQSVEAYYHSTYTFLSGLVLELYNSLLFNIHGWVGTQEGDNEEIEDGEGCVLYLPAVWYKCVRIHINPVSWVSYIKPKSHPIFAQSLINLSLGLLYTLYPQLRAYTCIPLQELFHHSDLEQFSPKNYIIESLSCFVEHLWQLYI